MRGKKVVTRVLLAGTLLPAVALAQSAQEWTTGATQGGYWQSESAAAADPSGYGGGAPVYGGSADYGSPAAPLSPPDYGGFAPLSPPDYGDFAPDTPDQGGGYTSNESPRYTPPAEGGYGSPGGYVTEPSAPYPATGVAQAYYPHDDPYGGDRRHTPAAPSVDYGTAAPLYPSEEYAYPPSYGASTPGGGEAWRDGANVYPPAVPAPQSQPQWRDTYTQYDGGFTGGRVSPGGNFQGDQASPWSAGGHAPDYGHQPGGYHGDAQPEINPWAGVAAGQSRRPHEPGAEAQADAAKGNPWSFRHYAPPERHAEANRWREQPQRPWGRGEEPTRGERAAKDVPPAYPSIPWTGGYPGAGYYPGGGYGGDYGYPGGDYGLPGGGWNPWNAYGGGLPMGGWPYINSFRTPLGGW